MGPKRRSTWPLPELDNMLDLLTRWTRDKEKKHSSELKVTIHAVLIGIDKYKSDDICALTGAVADVELVKIFLTFDLGIPESSITVLKNESATRLAIIDALNRLADDEGINKGEAILIYFAGHGSTIGGKQVVIPYDAPQAAGDLKSVISDIKLQSLLYHLADKKGDNITVILDCCHSSSGTRKTHKTSEYLSRGVTLNYQSTADDAPSASKWAGSPHIQPRGIATASKFLNTSLSSHVLLAACAEDEEARERDGQGLFTAELIKHLKIGGVSAYTYESLITSLDKLADNQTPQCEGSHKQRKLFNSLIQHRGQSLHHVSRHTTGAFIIQNTGEVTGATPLGSEFAVYQSRDDITRRGVSPLFYIVVEKIRAESCIARLRDGMPRIPKIERTAVALLMKAGEPVGSLYVYVPDSLLNDALIFDAVIQIRDLMPTQRWKISATAREHAAIGLIPRNNGRELEFEILDEQIRQLGLTSLSFTVPAQLDRLEDVLRAAARFFWHLRRSPKAHRLRDKVDLHVHKLAKADIFDDDVDYTLHPEESDIIPPITGIADVQPWNVVVDEEASHFGIELKNNDDNDGFFASLFYFDCSTLEIKQIYGCPAAALDAYIHPPLSPMSSLPLNYAQGGGEPLCFALSSEQNVDVGFVKAFVSRTRFDLSGIEQAPLETIPLDSGMRGLTLKKPSRTASLSTLEIWDEITLPVRQIRAA